MTLSLKKINPENHVKNVVVLLIVIRMRRVITTHNTQSNKTVGRKTNHINALLHKVSPRAII